jgi:hypothetical protein
LLIEAFAKEKTDRVPSQVNDCCLTLVGAAGPSKKLKISHFEHIQKYLDTASAYLLF